MTKIEVISEREYEATLENLRVIESRERRKINRKEIDKVCREATRKAKEREEVLSHGDSEYVQLLRKAGRPIPMTLISSEIKGAGYYDNDVLNQTYDKHMGRLNAHYYGLLASMGIGTFGFVVIFLLYLLAEY